jgi:hypothetical protein
MRQGCRAQQENARPDENEVASLHVLTIRVSLRKCSEMFRIPRDPVGARSP